jgi:uncharacterized membrane protein YphA (DoxX/SURF4 family)
MPTNPFIDLWHFLTGNTNDYMHQGLPLPVSDGLQYWTEQESTNAAFEFHRTFLKDVVLPHMTIFGPIVFLAELVFAGSMILGLAVRFAGVLATAYTLQLWLGLYDNASEWPWTYNELIS